MSTTIPTEISTFAARVRAQLADLPGDELEELTEGLEADLAEAYAEDLARELPDPVAYAAELRAAAGLPPKEDRHSGLAGVLVSLRQGVSETWRDVTLALRRNPVGRGVLDFVSVLQPVWWVTRAWLATWLVSAFFGWESGFAPTTLGTWILLAAFVTVSVQWGRGLWGAPRIGPLLVLGNVVAAVALLPVVAIAQSWESATYDAAYVDQGFTEPDLTGLQQDGEAVTNIFAYDALGRPLRDVQLFTSEGDPLRTSVVGGNGCTDAACASTSFWSPAVLGDGRVAWNVYPMRMLLADDGLGVADGAQPRVVPLPFEKASVVDRKASMRTSALASVFEAAGFQVPSALPAGPSDPAP